MKHRWRFAGVSLPARTSVTAGACVFKGAKPEDVVRVGIGAMVAGLDLRYRRLRAHPCYNAEGPISELSGFGATIPVGV